jgi:dTDP-4-dehydrorhamnose reductase
LQINTKYSNIYVTSHESSPIFGKSIQLDLRKTEKVYEKLKEIRPDIIVNLAALSDVERCEIDRDVARCLNRDLVAAISRYVYDNNAFLLHISTDCVFDGNEGNYREDSQTNPVNYYGMTKLQGENEIISKICEEKWCIARISTAFGIHEKKKGLPSLIIEKLRTNKSVKVIIDQYTSPTYALNLADMLKEIIDKKINGIIHTSGASRLSRYEQALKVCRFFGLNEELISGIVSNDMNWKANRPIDSSLNVDKACKVLQNTPKSFDQALELFSKEIHMII